MGYTTQQANQLQFLDITIGSKVSANTLVVFPMYSNFYTRTVYHTDIAYKVSLQLLAPK